MLVGICGALRAESSNRKLMFEAARLYGGEFLEADIRFPLYDNDLEDRDGVPAGRLLSEQIGEAEAVIIAAPEYNQSFSGVLKNALDWVSRTKGAPWRDKPVAHHVLGGGTGRGRACAIRPEAGAEPVPAELLTGPEVLVADGPNQFDAEGRLVNEITLKSLDGLMEALRAAARG